MLIQLQVIKRAARNVLHAVSFNSVDAGRSHMRYDVVVLIALVLLSAPVFAVRAQQTSPSPSTTTQTPPAGTAAPREPRPGAPSPAPSELPPNSSSAPIRPENEAQQSAQPQTGPTQERQQTTPDTRGPRPITPQTPTTTETPGGLPSTSTPAGTTAPPTTTGTTPSTGGAQPAAGVPQAPGQNVGVSTGVAPAELPQDPPPVAPNFEAPQRPLPSAERVGVDVGDQLSLSLNEAVRLALQNNNDIDASRIDVQIAEYNLNGARGIYDPLFSSESYYERRTTPTSSTIGGGGASGTVTQTDATGALRLGGFSPFAGGAYQLDFSSTRLTTTNQNATLNPQFPTALTFTYTQPLWRGLRFDENRRRIEIAKKNLSLTDAQFRQRVIDVISQIEQAYWDLVFALRNLQVQIDAVKQARLQLESNQRLVEKGVLAPIDVVAATTQITTFEQSVYTAQEGVTRAENTLKTLMLPDRSSELWSRALTPTTPVSLEAPRVPLEQATSAAIRNRPELAQLKTSADINDIDVRYFRDQTKPQIDLVGTYSTVGLAGTFVPRVSTGGANAVLTERVNLLSTLEGLDPLVTSTSTSTVAPNLVGGYAQSLNNLIAQTYPTTRVGVRISLPLRNRTAEANLGVALAQRTRLKDTLAQAEQLIEADVRNSLQAVRSAEARLASAAAGRSSAEQQFASEQRQFRAGTTTVFLVLQRQTDLLAARARELQAQTDLNKAIAQFQRSTGSTLEVNNVSVRTDTPMRELEQRPLQRAETNAAAGSLTNASSNSFTTTTTNAASTPGTTEASRRGNQP